jgi:Na+/H+-translocating membrane pyrophosphatase
MKTYKILFILSLILVVLPVIGIYSNWKQVIVFAIGAYTASLALSLWRKAKQEAIRSNKLPE